MTERILVCGTKDLVTKRIMVHLAGEGFKVSGFLPNDVSQDWITERIKIYQGSLNDQFLLNKLIDEHDIVYIHQLAGLVRNKKFQIIHSIVNECKRNDIRKIIFNSCNRPLDRNFTGILKNSGLGYLVFHPSNFMETVYSTSRKGTNLFLLEPKRKDYWLSATDFAIQVSNAIKNKNINSGEFVINGPEKISLEDFLKRFQKAYNKEKLKLIRVPRLLGFILNKKQTNHNLISIEQDKPFSRNEFGNPKVSTEGFATMMN